MSYWVHVEADGHDWHDATAFDSPLPPPVAGKGYPVLRVECDGVTFQFSSLDELGVCIDNLGKKLLLTTIRLTQDRGRTVGPNTHWLSRLPPKAKPWRYREKAVKYLSTCLVDFEREIGGEER